MKKNEILAMYPCLSTIYWQRTDAVRTRLSTSITSLPGEQKAMGANVIQIYANPYLCYHLKSSTQQQWQTLENTPLCREERVHKNNGFCYTLVSVYLVL